MKNLAIFTGADVRYFTGGHRTALELTKIKDFNVTVFSYIGKKGLRMSLKELKNYIGINGNLYFYRTLKFYIINLPITYSGIKAFLAIKNFDTVYNMDNTITSILLLTFICKIYKKKLILGLHDADLFTNNRNIVSEKRTIRDLTKTLYIKFRAITYLIVPNIRVVNREYISKLRKIGYNKKIYFIPDLIFAKPNRVKINKKKFIVLFTGRLDIKHKGIDLLCKMIDIILQKSTNIEFNIAGSGSEGKDLIHLLEIKYPKNVKWFGFVSNKKLKRLYENSCLFIFPSRIESFGLSLAEAQIYGLPAIAFNVRGPKMIIKIKIQGELIPPFNIEKFVRSIFRYYNIWSKNKSYYLNIKREISKAMKFRFNDNVTLIQLSKMFDPKL